MPITEQQLLQIMPKARPVVGAFLPALNRAMVRWRINSPVRQAAFLAQVGHESGQPQVPVANVPAYANDSAAATGGVPVCGFYRISNALQIRIA